MVRAMQRAETLIAVVEDDARVRMALERLLACVGYAVRGYTSGTDFLAQPLQREPDCLVLDLHMPGLSGLDVQARLAASGRTVPVVVITAQDTQAERKRALAAGATAYLCKPVDRDELTGAIEHAIANKAAIATTEEKRSCTKQD